MEMEKLAPEEVSSNSGKYLTDPDALRTYLKYNDQRIMFMLEQASYGSTGRQIPTKPPSMVPQDWTTYFISIPITLAMYNALGELMGGKLGNNIIALDIRHAINGLGDHMIQGVFFISPEGLRRIDQFVAEARHH